MVYEVMEPIWNDFDLKKPPLVTLPVTNTIFGKQVYVAINKYLQQLNGADASEFNQTAALLARLMARRKNSFRMMIGFRSICKLNVALCRLLRVDLPRELQHFRGALPDVYDDQLAGNMPTRNSLDYILIRIINVHYIHVRINKCCREAADYFAKMLRSAYFIDINTLLIAVIAKIHKLGEIMDNKCTSLYNILYSYRQQFSNIDKHEFIPRKMQLPTELVPIRKISNKNSENTLSNPNTITKAPNAPKIVHNIDMGITVKRAIEPKSKPKAFNVQQLKTVDDVNKFIANENEARKKTPHNCITKSLLSHEWQAAQKLFKKKLLAQEGKKALNIFRQFISNKI